MGVRYIHVANIDLVSSTHYCNIDLICTFQQAVYIIISLGWLFVPVYIASGVSTFDIAINPFVTNGFAHLYKVRINS